MQNPAIAADEGDRGQKDTVKLEVRRTMALFTFAVLACNQKVADIRESVEENKSIGHWRQSPYDHVPPKRALEIRVAGGLDMSIVSDVCQLRFNVSRADRMIGGPSCSVYIRHVLWESTRVDVHSEK